MIFDEAFLNKFYSNIGKPNKNDCTEWLRKTKHHRYGNIKLKGKDYKVHRISYQINFGEIPKNMYVCHSCDNTWCVNPEHLFLGSQLDNVRDMIKKGRKTVLKGTQLYEAKLNEKKIIAIKTKLDDGFVDIGWRYTSRRNIYQ